jgi:glycerophosphoryl diester phosphodiesterase
MQVHPYTVRADQLPPYATDVNQLYEVLYNQAGVDGLFTDFPDKAVEFIHRK